MQGSSSEVWLSDVVFLGHVISMAEIAVDLAKVEIVLSWESYNSYGDTKFLRTG